VKEAVAPVGIGRQENSLWLCGAVRAPDRPASFLYSKVFFGVVWPAPDAFRVKEHDSTVSRIYTDLFNDESLTSIKDCVTRFNVLCLLKHGITLPRGSRVDLDHLTDVGSAGGVR
jgi:hypothetical protein